MCPFAGVSRCKRFDTVGTSLLARRVRAFTAGLPLCPDELKVWINPVALIRQELVFGERRPQEATANLSPGRPGRRSGDEAQPGKSVPARPEKLPRSLPRSGSGSPETTPRKKSAHPFPSRLVPLLRGLVPTGVGVRAGGHALPGQSAPGLAMCPRSP